MVKKIKAYFETLEGLSTKALTDSAENLVRDEKRSVALLIAHIAEMSRRKAELACGYKNVFEYCVRRLNLSEGSVALRLQVANVSRRFPQILVALAENRISLTVAGHFAPHIREDNVDKLLSDCAGMTKRAVEEYLAKLRPKPVFNPSIRKRPSSKQESDKAGAGGQQEVTQEKEQPNQAGSAPPVEETPSQRPPSSSPNVLEPARHDIFNFRFSADANFKAKFERLAEVLGVENPLKNMAEVFERAMDISLEKKDPKKKLERRLQKERKRNASQKESRPDKIPTDEEAPTSGGNKAKSRYIPSEVREHVYARAAYRCEFRGPDGTRCSSRTGLEIDHERPFAIYRSHDEHHLRLLCRRHNRFQAERVYGAEFIRAKIEEKKSQKDSAPSCARRSPTVTSPP
jgi:hypothetical protein